MIEINVCPSTLQEGYSTYSPMALKQLFDGQPVSHIFAADIPLAKELIERSFLSDALKRSYWLSYKYRRNTLSTVNNV